MRIIAFVNGNSGPSYHRLIMPLMLMEDVDVFITNNLLEEHFEKGCDVFMYGRTLPAHADEKIAELRRKYEFRTIIDIDDYWELDPHHILYELYQTENFAAEQIRHIKAADAVLTTNERLAEEIGQFNREVFVLPNAIPRQGQFVLEREPYYLVRLFWQGSITHRYDIGIIQHSIDQLKGVAGKIKMVLHGYMDGEPEWVKMASMYTAGFKHQYQIIPGEHVTKYYEAYKHADVCLVPLVASKFNSMKSNLKVLEAANMGLPVIASKVHPYLDMPVLYASKGSDWVQHVKRLLASKKRRRDAGLELQEYCNQHFNFKKINHERKQIIEHVAV